MKIDILTLFPEMFTGFLETSIIKRAINNKIVEVKLHDYRKFSDNPHNHVDDKPYGGGQGMLIQVGPIVECLKTLIIKETIVVLMSPQGQTFNQKLAQNLREINHLIIICGHYEGYDERIRDYVDYEISIGDYVLTGGELGAMVISDAIIRLLEGTIKEASFLDDSFASGLLEYPQYTRPYEYDGNKVPDVLISGNHEEIRKWRKYQAIKRTYIRRPELLDNYEFDQEGREMLDLIIKEK